MTSKDNDFNSMDFRMPSTRRLQVGEVIDGQVVLIGESHVFLDVGAKSEATIDLQEITDDEGHHDVKVGDTLHAYIVSVEPEVVLSYARARSHLSRERLQDAYDMGVPVQGKVTGVNKGGLEIDLGGVRAFCPISQIDVNYCEDSSIYLEQTLEFRVTEFAQEGRNVVVSRRALLQEQRDEQAEVTRAQLFEGAEIEAEVVTLQPYGAFVDLGGGIQGLVHISEIGHSRVEHPEEVLKVGQKVRVKILRVEPDPKNPKREKIGLSIKALLGDPWDGATADLVEGATVTGRVVRLQPYGAFVEIAPGVDGLIHVSELSDRRINHPSEVVQDGQTVTVTVLKVDHKTHRVSLSLLGSGQGSGEDLSVGSVVDAVVNRIKPFGLLVQIKGAGKNARGLIPAEDTGTGKGANLRKAFPEGTEVRAMITSVEPDTGRMRLSITGVVEQQEREEFAQLQGGGATAGQAAGGGKTSFGTLGDLLKSSMKKKRGR